MNQFADSAFKPIISMNDLEFRLGEDRETLRRIAANWKNEYSPFVQLKPAKPFQRVQKAPKPRTIDNPSKELKRIQSKILKRLLHPVTLPHFMFGAVPGRSIKDHAEAHLGKRCIVKMDIKSYYPNVTSKHVYSVWHNTLHYSRPIASLLTKLTTYKWHLPQGAPTSPALANIFLASIYSPVLERCSAEGITVTTWVDDLIFSGDKAPIIMELVRQTLADNGFKLSARKREILRAQDSKVVTGVRLGAGRVRAPKEKLRDLRAAIHKLEVRAIAPEQCEAYLTSLQGKIKHVEQLCKQDADGLKRNLHRVMEKLSKVQHPQIDTHKHMD